MITHCELDLIGTVGKDPVVTNTNDKKRAFFSVAVHSFSGGEKHTEWYDVIAWNGTADIVENMIQSGTWVFIKGGLQRKDYVNREGLHVKDVQINAHKVIALKDAKPKDQGMSVATNSQEQDGAAHAPIERKAVAERAMPY